MMRLFLGQIKNYIQASRNTAMCSTDFQITLFSIGSKSPLIALFLVIFTIANF